MELAKKYVLLLTIILILALNTHYASSIARNELSINLVAKDRYGISQLLTGTLSVTAGELSAETPVKVYINNNKKADIFLQSLLDSALIPYTSSQPEYTPKSSAKDITSSSSIVGFRIPKSIVNAKAKISGNSNSLSFDIGNDRNPDWQYFNQREFTLSNPIYPELASSAQLTPDRALMKPDVQRCEDIYLDFNPLANSSLIQIVAQVIKKQEGSNLKANIANIGECDMPEPTPLNSLETVGCDIKMDNPSSALYTICLYASTGSNTESYYQVPFATLQNSLPYYFFYVRQAEFSTNFEGSATLTGSKFTDAINTYFSSCELDQSGFCLVPMRILSSSSITISDIELIDESGIVYSSIYDISYIPPVLSIYDTLNIPLEKLNVAAPSTVKAQNELEIVVGSQTKTLFFDTVQAPVAKVRAIKSEAGLLELVSFDGSLSTPTSNNKIAKYDWDFGDNIKLSTTQPYASHAFSTVGRQKVSLVVTDSSGLESSPAFASLDILTGEQSIDGLLLSTELVINNTKNYFSNANADVREVVELLNYESSLNSAFSDLKGLKLKVENIKSSTSGKQREDEFILAINEIKSLQDSIPSILNIKSSLILTQALDYSQLLNPKTFDASVKDVKAANIAIYNHLSDYAIQAEAKSVNVRYVSGKDEIFTLVKKSITTSSTPDYVIEYSPIRFSKIITQGSSINDNTIKYPSSTREIVYTINADLQAVKDTMTLPIPDLSSLPSIPEIECGDKICNFNEALNIDEDNPDNKYYCPQDCRRDIRWGRLSFIIIIALLGLYYINFYHGPFNFKDVTNAVSVSLFRRRIFTSKKDITNLTNFVKTSLAKGFTKEQIAKILYKKGWTDDQIKSIFASMKK